MKRRSLVAGAVLAACTRRISEAAPAPPLPEAGTAPGDVRYVHLELSGTPVRVLALVPGSAREGERFPLVVALHGRGEARKRPEDGVYGWPRDYALARAYGRVSRPPLVRADLEGFVDEARLRALNARLAARPFGGLVVACPYLPDVELRDPAQVRPLVDFVATTLLPRLRAELPVLAAPEATGIDGVSLGGALALWTGLRHPESFGAVGSLQAAVDDAQIPELVALARAARAARPGLALRLLTSDRDYFRDVLGRLSKALGAAGVAHEHVLVPGPHDYPFNRGPGAVELLTWHDERLKRS